MAFNRASTASGRGKKQFYVSLKDVPGERRGPAVSPRNPREEKLCSALRGSGSSLQSSERQARLSAQREGCSYSAGHQVAV